MVLPHKLDKQLATLYWLLMTVGMDSGIGIGYCQCVHVWTLLYSVTSLANVFKLNVFAYCMIVTQKVRAETIFNSKEYTSLSDKKGWICNCSARILETLSVTICSLFLIMLLLSNQCPFQ
jgi:hypothetical protein